MAGLLFVPVFAVGLIAMTPSVSMAYTCADGTTAIDGAHCAKPENVPDCLFGEGCAFSNILNMILFVLGAISVLMLVYGGIRYTISGGNASSVTAAKNTILYAIIGLVVALMAYAIVNFVLTSLT